jgi:hypothetical protein
VGAVGVANHRRAWGAIMNIATVFEWFAQASTQLAEENNDPSQRERLLKLASLWAAAAQRSRNEASTQSTAPNREGPIRSRPARRLDPAPQSRQ